MAHQHLCQTLPLRGVGLIPLESPLKSVNDLTIHARGKHLSDNNVYNNRSKRSQGKTLTPGISSALDGSRSFSGNGSLFGGSAGRCSGRAAPSNRCRDIPLRPEAVKQLNFRHGGFFCDRFFLENRSGQARFWGLQVMVFCCFVPFRPTLGGPNGKKAHFSLADSSGNRGQLLLGPP
jgi:hypothetical protein